MLLSAGLSLPKKIFVHGFLNSGGKKMSKSLGNVITPEEIIEEYGAEALRYYLLREVTSYEDGDITKEKFKTAYNANLANGLGNLTSRIMKMAENNLDKPVDIEREVVPSDFLNNLEFHKFMDYIWEQISETDLYIQETEPFKLIKINPAQAKDVIRDLVQKLNSIAVLLEPVMPESAQKIQNAIKENRMPSEPLFLRK
jgi:methionyl-tRNA synthetase